MKKEPKVIFYTDELNDEFSGTSFVPRKIDEKYPYEGGLSRKIGHVFWYHIIAIPLAYLFLYVRFRHKIINRHLLKEAKGAYFLYGNHTQHLADALIPTIIARPDDMHVIVHPDNVSMPFLGKITPCMGAVPLPDDGKAAKNFMKFMKNTVEAGKPVAIYPEAHIWPYYTGIRPFKNASFGYPIQYGVPVYCFTNTYRERKHFGRVQIVTYVDGPFYADESLTKKEQKEKLRNQVYETMCERSKNNQLEIIRYVKKNTDENEEEKPKVQTEEASGSR